jgi:hypothetical protein
VQIALILLLVLLVRVAQFVGQLYGWYYHALILVVLGASLAALFRLIAPKMPGSAPALPPTDDPEGIKIREFIKSAHRDFEQSVPAFRRDSILIPLLACAPAVALLCIFQQHSYLPSCSLWFRFSFIPVLLYVVFRYVIPKRRRNGA